MRIGDLIIEWRGFKARPRFGGSYFINNTKVVRLGPIALFLEKYK